MTHKISVNNAIELITNFVLHPQLTVVANEIGFGGTLTLNCFSQFGNDPLSSLLFWFCYQKPLVDGDTERFIIALENGPVQIDPETLPRPSAEQIISSQPFCFDGTSSPAGVKNYIKTQILPIPTADSTANRIETRVWSHDFIADFPPGRTNPFNTSKFGCINNGIESEVKEFIQQSPEIAAVRYFFGFDDNALNKIKVIFVPIDSTGKNITRFTNGSKPFYLDREEP